MRKITLIGCVWAIGIVLHTQACAASTYSAPSNTDISLSKASIDARSVYVTTGFSIVSGGEGYVVGDRVVNPGDGALFSVQSVDSTGAITALTQLWAGANTSDQTNNVFTLYNEDVSGSPSPQATLKITSTQIQTLTPMVRSIKDSKLDSYNPKDYGVLLDGSSGDLDRFSKFYALVPHNSVIKFPCGSKLPPFPTHNIHTGPVSMVNTDNKQVTWDLTCGVMWADGSAVDNSIGTGNDLVKLTMKGGEWWTRRQENIADWGPILNLSSTYSNEDFGGYSSGEFALINSAVVTANIKANTRATLQTFNIVTNDYENSPWSDQTTSLMINHNKYGDTSAWAFVAEMNDLSGAIGRGWSLTNEIDVRANGIDYGSDWQSSLDDSAHVYDPIYLPMDSSRKILSFLPQSFTDRVGKRWTPFTYYNKGDIVYTPNTNAILVAQTSGYSGTTEPNILGILPVSKTGTSKNSYTYQETIGSIQPYPHSTRVYLSNIFSITTSDGKSNYVYLSQGSPNDPHVYDQQSVGTDPTTPTSFVPYGGTGCALNTSCDGSATWVTVNPNDVTAATLAYNEGTNNKLVTWNKTNTVTEVTGLGIWFAGGVGTPFHINHKYDPEWDTLIFSNAIIYNAALDFSWTTSGQPNTAVLRMSADQKIDFTANGTEIGKNNHTLSYSSSDGAFEFKTSAGTTDPTSLTEAPVFQIKDDGTLLVSNAFGANQRVVTSHADSANNFSLSYNTGPTIHAWIDSSDMGIIPHNHAAAPTNLSDSCSEGEYFSTSEYHYVCTSSSTWLRIDAIDSTSIAKTLSVITAETHTEGDRLWCHDCRAPSQATGSGTGRWIYLDSASTWRTDDGLAASN